MMSTGAVDVVIFEGLAEVEVGGLQYDAYMSIKTQSVGYTTRWYGSFTWMGNGPSDKYDLRLYTRDVNLSDGRECQIKIPHLPTGDKVEFLGIGLPPGFELFGLDLVQEPEGLTTPSKPKRVAAGFFKTLALGSVVAAIWWGDHHWQLAATAGLSWLVGGLLSIPPRPPKVPSERVRPLDIPRG